MDTLTIRHRGRERTFRLVKGGYDFDRDRISISIETWAIDEQSPYAANFSLVNYAVPNGSLTAGMQFSFSDNHADGWDDQNTHANAYFDFHAESVQLTLKILTVDSAALTVQLSALTGDYGYDDDGRKPNPMTGTFHLLRTPKNELWIPS